MAKQPDFLNLVLDTVTEHIVVLRADGEIIYANRAWNRFGEENQCIAYSQWFGVNYLEACRKAAEAGDSFGEKAIAGIKAIVEGRHQIFALEYPCHSPEEERWFMMRVTSFLNRGKTYLVVSHQSITQRKLAEQAVTRLARLDPLTQIANRRTMDEFLGQEWRRCSRSRQPITVALVDLDHFKLLNDHHGHQSGDRCLQSIAEVLKDYTRRPTDLCARFGGEEFILIFSEADEKLILPRLEKLRLAIHELKLPNSKSPLADHVTASIGAACAIPDQLSHPEELIRQAN